MSKGLKIVVIAFLVGIGVEVWILWPRAGCGPPPHATLLHMHCQGDIARLSLACHEYLIDYGTNPTGDLAALVAQLKGDNPHHKAYMEFPSKKVNKRGEFIDPWGSPFEVSFDPTNGEACIRSAGRDKQFGDKDDITSWQ